MNLQKIRVSEELEALKREILRAPPSNAFSNSASISDKRPKAAFGSPKKPGLQMNGLNDGDLSQNADGICEPFKAGSNQRNILANEELDEPEMDSTPEQKVSLLVTYSLSKKSRSNKMLFNYELIGRNGKEGFLQILNGEKVTPGCVIIPADNGDVLEAFLNRHEVEFSKRRILTFNDEN